METIVQIQELQLAAKALAQGQLVAFPTQTVYGLGTNAFLQNSVLSIYQVKKRPITDPIIVHVLNFKQAKTLLMLTQEQEYLYSFLAKVFWPGPLTLIGKGNWKVLPRVLGGGTQYLGIRSPKNKIARCLLKQSKVPIAAPSANLFGHVSPTKAQHVLNDFKKQQIIILNGGQCQYGMQSTVVKIECKVLKILREGSLNFESLVKSLKLFDEQIKVEVVKKILKNFQQSESPGQLLKHYSPNLPTFILSTQIDPALLQNVAFVSFSTKYSYLKERCPYYYLVGHSYAKKDQDIGEKEWMKQFYGILREAQKKEVKSIVIGVDQKMCRSGCIWDKVYRATEGKQYSF